MNNKNSKEDIRVTLVSNKEIAKLMTLRPIRKRIDGKMYNFMAA